MTFQETATEWSASHFAGLSNSTKAGYEYNLSHHLLPDLGAEALEDIKYGKLQKILNELAAAGYSRRTVTGVRLTMRMVLDYAVKSEYCDRNPATYTTIPHFVAKPKLECITPTEADMIAKFTHEYQPFVMTLLHTGMRRGEALALTWEDVDLQSMVISISKAIEFVNNHAVVKKPKTSNSYRTVPIPAPLHKCLKQHKKRSKSEWLFTQKRTNLPHTQTSYKKMWARWYKDFSQYYYDATSLMPQKLTAHMFRHYYITFLFENSIPDLVIQNIAGHAEISFTRQRYTHLREGFKSQCYQQIINLYT